MHVSGMYPRGLARPWRWRRPRPDPWALIAVVTFLALAFVAIFGERIAPYEPIYFVIEHGDDPRPYDPGIVFPFGSDVLGRDLFSVVLAGARATVTIVLLAGLGRVLAGVLIATLGSWWRPARLVIESLAELVGAVPATLVALVLVRAFVKTDTSLLVLAGALLALGWAGPYRVIRAEIDRLAYAPFTHGALALGVPRWRLFWRHQLPHLAPVLAINLSQQIVASLVLVAELGVLGVIVGPVRIIDVEGSITRIMTGPPMAALIPDVPEWGALLASSRTVEALWVTRWVIFLPAAGFALTALVVAAIGLALARRYARRDVLMDLRGFGLVGVAVMGMFIASELVPERYAEAREWVGAARAALRPTEDLAGTLRDAGLSTSSVIGESPTIARAGPASISVGSVSLVEPSTTVGKRMRSLVTQHKAMEGGTVERPLVFAARGIVPSDAGQPVGGVFSTRYFPEPALGPLISGYPDDYAGIDVRDKVVLLVRFMGVTAADGRTSSGPSGLNAISDVVDRGAAAVLFVDPDLPFYTAARDPYSGAERQTPPKSTHGIPVVVLAPDAARELVAPLGIDLTPLLGPDAIGKRWERSLSREAGAIARVAVPLREDVTRSASLLAEVPGVPRDQPRLVVWAARGAERDALEPARSEVLAALARIGVERRAPLAFVDFDARAGPEAVQAALKDRRVALVVQLEEVEGNVLTFASANGDLIPAFDLYATKAGAQSDLTRRTARSDEVRPLIPGSRTVVVRARGAAGAARADAAAVIGYAAGRLVLGAPELRQ